MANCYIQLCIHGFVCVCVPVGLHVVSVCCVCCCSPLDELIDLLGGVDRVAEMTGRQARIVRQANGKLLYELRDAHGSGATLESINNLEVSKVLSITCTCWYTTCFNQAMYSCTIYSSCPSV